MQRGGGASGLHRDACQIVDGSVVMQSGLVMGFAAAALPIRNHTSLNHQISRASTPSFAQFTIFKRVLAKRLTSAASAVVVAPSAFLLISAVEGTMASVLCVLGHLVFPRTIYMPFSDDPSVVLVSALIFPFPLLFSVMSSFPFYRFSVLCHPVS